MELSKRAAIYARTATVQDTGPNFAMAEQLHQCQEHAAREGYEVVAVYQEVGRGSSIDRPVVKALLQSAEEGKFTVLLLLDIDRISRSYEQITAFLSDMERLGVKVKSVREPFAGDTDLNMFVQHIHAMVSDMQRHEIRKRMQYGRQAMRQARSITR